MPKIGQAIKQTRQERKLTQEELGKLIIVQKAQISRIENNASNVTVETLMRASPYWTKRLQKSYL